MLLSSKNQTIYYYYHNFISQIKCIKSTTMWFSMLRSFWSLIPKSSWRKKLGGPAKEGSCVDGLRLPFIVECSCGQVCTDRRVDAAEDT